MIKPTKVLCKRTLTIGKNHWWDDTVNPPIRHEHDNRILVAGNWYDVVHNENDVWDEEKRIFTFTVIDNQSNPHLHFMYEEQDRASWPDICIKYGTRDYAKWFYTPEELDLLAQGKFKLDKDIFIKIGNHHWVKTKEGNWIIALCSGKHPNRGIHWWTIIGSDIDKTDYDFSEIGEQIVSQKEQLENIEKNQVWDELMDEVSVLVDSINKNNHKANYPSVEYVMPFVNKAIDKYLDNSFKHLEDSDLFKSSGAEGGLDL